MRVPANQRGLGMVFQSYAIWPHMNVFENVAFPLKVLPRKQRPGAQAMRERVERVLASVAARPARRPRRRPTSRAASSSASRSPARS